MKLKGWHMEAIRAALIMGATILAMGACQSMPEGWRIGAGGAVAAALGCIDDDDPTLSKRQRVARCTGRILAEAGEVAEAIGEAAVPSGAAPGSTVWRARHRDGPPCIGWRYRYKRA